MIRAGGFGLGPGWLTQTLSTIRKVANAEPTLDLYRSGAFVGSYTFRNLGEGISAPAAAHEIRATSQYEIGEVSGSSSAVISFDTRRFDSKPPYVSNFHIEQNGIRTPSPFYPSNATPVVKFRVTGSSSVALDWRMNGTDTWTPLPLTITGSDYEALIEQEGAIDLRLTAADSAGNTFQEEWTPALITTAPPPPGPPSFLSATRAAAAQIALSWAAASGVLEISRYRIERLPDNATFETSGPETAFDDTTGLVPGNAYLYRVSAIDTNGGVSSPSPYDLATLIELQDDPLVPNATLIRGAHVVDLRRAIDAIRVAAGLGPAWTNDEPPAGRVHASVFSELRNRLNEARGTLALPTVEFLNTVAPGSVIRATDVEALRDGVQ